MERLNLPTYNDMPPVEGMPHGCAWGLFDKDGVRDEVGTLNHLTPSVVARAAQEINTGKHVSLNWGLEKIHKPEFGRIATQHRIIDWLPLANAHIYDDELTLNTQSGSQWDGLRHFAHTPTGRYYQGTHHSELLTTDHLGIDHWHRRGGIVARGVLIDYAAWADSKGIEFDAWRCHKISLETVKRVAREQGTEFREGDLLVVRSGWIRRYEGAGEEERGEALRRNEHVGVEGTREVLEWLWDGRFSAVAGDSIGFECWPGTEPWRLHDNLLSLWGMPIGEMWDLEALSEECKRQNRWSFFLTSAPLNTKNGVASPPNAIAIF
ncbi:hypothetical protein K402DRAFT_329700 [Aulographum hederae CBS 113979]|uniref:Cyclase n=1 Tax=Aulographum hederae CBS 113979 TaxID=1176131 RepID=A0A6G1H3S9_9PEZI|nr:hypothetical protein K402DRAFT_329700 [Aulographum hederae CBS 113979]